jgi:putative methyltransferase/type III restriction/modification enzyme restriction subunit/helicase-like protein/integrase-like protein
MLKFLPFVEAREYVHNLKLLSKNEWGKYCKTGNRPTNIPTNPPQTYRRQWKDWGDWLGTGTVAVFNGKFKSFDDGRVYVRGLGLKSQNEWRQYLKSGKKPNNIPANPSSVYKTKWKGFGDWLGNGNVAPSRKNFRPFPEARQYVHTLKLMSQNDWNKWRISGRKPNDIPSNPARTYRRNWNGWPDWLGKPDIKGSHQQEPIPINIKPFNLARDFSRSLGLKNKNQWKEFCKSNRKPSDIPSYPLKAYSLEWMGWADWIGIDKEVTYLSFLQARDFVRSLKLKNKEDWSNYRKLGKIPRDIPGTPNKIYSEWNGWGDWLGTGRIANQNREFLSFNDAREYVRSLNLKSSEEWSDYSKFKRPRDIPSTPDRYYEDEWRGWGDWLGTTTLGEVKLRNFTEARAFIQGLHLKNFSEWKSYSKSSRPHDIPGNPHSVYRTEWKGYGDWLGTGRIADKYKTFKKFSAAREFIHSIKLASRDKWEYYCKSMQKPTDIPASPWRVYKKDWNGWPDWLGYEESRWSPKKVKELLRGLIESKIIYHWDEAVLYSFLLRKGLLNVQGRHAQFFKNLIEARGTAEGRRLIEDYAKSDSQNPPDLRVLAKKSLDDSNEIETATSKELTTRIEDDPLDYQNDWSVEEILSHTDALESINVDEEAMQFYLDYSVDELWKCAFRNEDEAVKNVKETGKNGNKYHDIVVETFLSDYEGSTKLQIPNDYSFPHPPTLMQRYVAYKVTSLPYLGNFSGTGAGKTLSAILASRTIDSKVTVIVCPNDVVDQWKRNILDTFPNSNVITGKDGFSTQYSENQYQYAVLNYDKFSQEESPNLILNLAKQMIDFVILDEIHFTKIRNEEEVSQRRRNLDGLMTGIRKLNPNVKVLGLSATPVVNNLREGRSLLELISGKVYDDVAVRPTIPNAVTLYEKLSTVSIRELPRYSIDVDTHTVDVTARRPVEISIRQLKSNPLAIEKFLTDARIPEMLKLIDGQTIIYTEYVEDIIQNLSDAVEQAGYSYALYTGFDRSGLTRFLNKKVQVLIASRPLSVGVDGLQHICNRLIINTLPWTNAQYQQLIGRLVRKGQIRDVVHVYLVKASIGGYQYDELKWKRIQFKRTLADCAVDGRLPEKNLVTPQQAAMEAVKWLERLERGEISTVVRRDLNVEITPVEIKKRVIKYGDFTRLNNKINNENSDTTHSRVLKDPKEWDEYHRQYREARKSWPIIPFEEIIKRISQLSPRLLIGDFGCGEAKMLEKFGTERVFSFDHVAINNKVTACDIKSVPLSDEAIDIAVFSLSLMGRNWSEYIKEAKRCLATNGYLLIAETTKSMKGRLSKIKEIIEQQGFNIYNQEVKGDFTFIEAREL